MPRETRQQRDHRIASETGAMLGRFVREAHESAAGSTARPPMSTDELVRRYTAAKERLIEEAQTIANLRPDDYPGAALYPASAVALTLDALWQFPALAELLADYFRILAQTRDE